MTLAIDTERDYLADDIIADAHSRRHGSPRRAGDAGLGVEVDLDAQLERYSRRHDTGRVPRSGRPGWFPMKPAY